MFREDEPIGRIARYFARSRLGAELRVRLEPIKQKVEPHYRRLSIFYNQYCAPIILRARAFIQEKIREYKKYREQQRRIAEDHAAQQAEAARKREAELEEERAAAARAAYDPEGAIEDMRLAYSYLQDCRDDSAVDKQALGLAAKYIELARTKDQNAELTIEHEKGPNKGETHTYSLDELSSTALFYESQAYSRSDATPQDLQHARELLIRAIAYYPYYPIMYRSLAQVHLNLHDKTSALAVAEDAVKHIPKNIDARKLLDYVQAAPVTEAATLLDTQPGCVYNGIALILFFISVVVALTTSFKFGVAIFVMSAIAAWIGHSAEGSLMFKKALEKQAKDGASKR